MRQRGALLRQAFFVVLALLLGMALLYPRLAGSSETGVAPGVPVATANAMAPADGAGDPPADSAATAPPEPQAATAPPEPQEKDPHANPIDLATAPDGGVPSHPGASKYRSPFASPTGGSATPIKIGMLLNSVDDYDIKTGTFKADFFLSLTSSKPMPPINLKFPNGKVDDRETLADKATFKMYRLSGSFKSPPDLRAYPYDTQNLKILIEDDLRGIDQFRLTVDKERTQLGRGFRALGWRVNHVEARSLSLAYPERFEGDDLYYGRYIFTLNLERFATSAVFKVYVPAFVIVIISLLGMWVPATYMEVRSNSGAPMLAGAVLFHFALMQELPATSYLTRADKLMLGVYIVLLLGMLSTWCMFLVKAEHMDRVFQIARALVPALSALVMTAACML
jgi:hypothetical protein